MKKSLLLFLLLLPYICFADDKLSSSRELLYGLDGTAADVLFNVQHVFRYDEEKIGLQYCPDTDSRETLIRLNSQLSPEVMVEGLYLIPYPENMTQGNKKEIIDELFGLSHKVSSIAGAKYFSVRKDSYQVLFTDTYAVNNLKDKKRIPDPEPSSLSTGDRVFLHMRENALGRGYYRIDYGKSSSGISISMINESSLGFILPAVSPEDMQIFLDIIPCSDAILVYGYCGVVLQNDDFVNLLLDPYYAFYRRMTAMETWLYNILHDSDVLPPIAEPMP